MVDKLPQCESLEQESTLENIQEQTQEVICRLFFVRHGVSVEEMKKGKNSKQYGGSSSLHEEGKIQIEEAAEILKKMGCKKEETLILYAPGKDENDLMKRVIESAEILEDKAVGKLRSHDGLDTSKKMQLEDGTVVIEDGWLFTRVEQLYEIMKLTNQEILKSFMGKNDLDYKKYKNIVLLGHKSNAPGITEISKDEGEIVQIGNQNIVPGDVWQFDINKKNEYVNYSREKCILCLNYNNIDRINAVLNNKELLKEQINLFNIGYIKSFDLQNFINKHFQAYPELYEKYLSSENEDLRTFCLANLIRLKRYKNISIFLEKDLKLLSISEQKNIFDIIKKEKNILEKFLQIFFEDKQDSNEYTNLKGYMIEELLKLGDDEILLMNYYENIYPLVKDIREKSLDMRIVNGEDIHPKFNLDQCMIESLLKNDGDLLIYHYNEKIKDSKKVENNDEIKKLENPNIITNIAVKKAISEIMSRNMSHNIDKKILYIEANSGTGKSFLLSQINEKIKNIKFMENGRKIFPIFINLSGEESIKSLKDKIISIQDNYKKIVGRIDSIVMLDSLDESNFNEEEKKELLTYLSNKSELSSGVIITSRKGYVSKDTSDNDRGDTLKKIGIVQLKEMDNLDVDIYVKEYFGDKKDSSRKIEEFNTLKNNQWFHGIEKNPLILSMICYLIETGNDIKNITSIGGLYEQIVDLRLRYRESKKNKQGRRILVDQENSEKGKEADIQGIINKRKEFLGELAYQEVLEGKRIDEDSFSMLKGKYPGIIPDKDCLNLLFRKSDNNKEFDFIHQSFKDYFLLKGFENDCDEGGKIKKECEKKYNGEILHKLGIRAIYLGYISILELLIKNGYYVDYKNPRALISNFMLACQFGSKEVVERFFDKINFDSIMDKDIYGKYVFTFACRNGDKEVSELFYRNIQEIKKTIGNIKENEKENIKDFYNKRIEDSINNAFMDACTNGRIDIIERLIDKNADIHIKDKEGKNGFMLACQYGYIEIAKRLSDKGADIHTKDKEGNNAFMIACIFLNIEIAKRLADDKGADIHAKNKEGRNAFMIACISGRTEIAKQLSDKGADIHAKDKEGMNAFMYACAFGRTEIAERLASKGADIHAKNKEGRSAFMHACSDGHIETAKRLSDEGIDIHIKDKEGKTAFMVACGNGGIEAIKRLSDKGADIHAEDKKGRTAFMLVCEYGYIRIAKRLSDKRADIHAKDKEGMNAFMYACRSGQIEIAKRLSDKGADIHAKDKEGKSAFMHACENSDIEVVKRLIDKIVTTVDDLEKSILIAKEKGYDEIVKIIQDKIHEMEI